MRYRRPPHPRQGKQRKSLVLFLRLFNGSHRRPDQAYRFGECWLAFPLGTVLVVPELPFGATETAYPLAARPASNIDKPVVTAAANALLHPFFHKPFTHSCHSDLHTPSLVDQKVYQRRLDLSSFFCK